MTHKVKILHFGAYILEYHVFGEGTSTIIAFHGFGQSGYVWNNFEPLYQNNYRLIGVTLFHHEGSSCPTDKPIETLTFVSVLETLLTVENITKFVLMGYSIGGKIALSIYQFFADRVERLVVLAPDGIIHHPLYSFAVHTLPGRAIHRWFIKNPGIFRPFAKVLYLMGIVKSNQIKFFNTLSNTLEQRERGLKVWQTFSLMEPNLELVIDTLVQNGSTCILIMGNYDKIIPIRNGIYFSRKNQKVIQLNKMQKGHNLITPEMGSKIVQLFANHNSI